MSKPLDLHRLMGYKWKDNIHIFHLTPIFFKCATGVGKNPYFLKAVLSFKSHNFLSPSFLDLFWPKISVGIHFVGMSLELFNKDAKRKKLPFSGQTWVTPEGKVPWPRRHQPKATPGGHWSNCLSLPDGSNTVEAIRTQVSQSSLSFCLPRRRFGCVNLCPTIDKKVQYLSSIVFCESVS